MDQKQNPIVAGLLAIIPGMGHFYLKDIFYAILYFVIFWIAGILTAIYLIKEELNGYYIPAAIGFGCIWAYGMYDAYRDCKRMNENSPDEGGVE